MSLRQQIVIERTEGKPFAADYHLPSRGTEKLPVIIIVHGFKGFKDWGHFPLIAEHLSRSGFAVVRFNFSMNGTTLDKPDEFANLEAFGHNTYSQEIRDVQDMIENIFWKSGELPIDPERIGILGHSRGGGISLLTAARDERIKAVATWASVCEFESRMNPAELKEWKKNGVIYQHNSRTGQDMPLYLDIRNDYYEHHSQLLIEDAVRSLHIPLLFVHGDKDETVNVREAGFLNSWNLFSKLEIIPNANHTFGGRHPWPIDDLPDETKLAMRGTIAFFRENL